MTAVNTHQIDILLESHHSKSSINLPEDFRVTMIARGQLSFILKTHTDQPWTDRRLPGVTIPAIVIMRVSLPWAPYYGTESEVVAMLFASRQGVSVPRVYFFGSSTKNGYDIEFIIQEFSQGKGLDTNHSLIPEAVGCWYQLWNSSNFIQSGTLYYKGNSKTFFFDPMVDQEFFASRLDKLSDELPEFGSFPTWTSYVEALLHVRRQRDWTKCHQRLSNYVLSVRLHS
ncbi:hypothetical protein QBC36DRAFT_313577 [Triangularia setosa]|uniref:Uncharacterized protein n=1 Tax=Triangularia setosa TaxID=2587417 RepID=A0AAN7A647_9PEZI|nr:hypothetical protein QBC36DRAFT_313577 [Podospora setosa]